MSALARSSPGRGGHSALCGPPTNKRQWAAGHRGGATRTNLDSYRRAPEQSGGVKTFARERDAVARDVAESEYEGSAVTRGDRLWSRGRRELRCDAAGSRAASSRIERVYTSGRVPRVVSRASAGFCDASRAAQKARVTAVGSRGLHSRPVRLDVALAASYEFLAVFVADAAVCLVDCISWRPSARLTAPDEKVVADCWLFAA